LQVKREKPMEFPEHFPNFVLQPILQCVFPDGVYAILHSALLARRKRERITVEQLAEALAALCSWQVTFSAE
jgi:hypothetical protein